jgi:exo-beta-1,3-glucanase (GH17 family)
MRAAGPNPQTTMARFVGLFVATAIAIAAAWWWLGAPIALPPSAADPGRIPCLSYAPFRADQSPLIASTHVEASQIEEDLAKLAGLTGCVRTYSIENGLDQVPAIAERLGLKLLQGLWLGNDRQKNRVQIDQTVALARRYPDTITGIVAGNEVLLRGELPAEELAGIMREVKAASGIPVTYADVWEFWLRNRELAEAADFITIHILPYWEDFPVAAERAGDHVDRIVDKVKTSFPGKDILVGEVGWPSAGRMREGALPSLSNEALVLAEVMARARAKGYRVNLIEAFDQPWKRRLEGTVGGYWGLFGESREPKFAWGLPVSDHPAWHWQLRGGVALAPIIFAGVVKIRRRVLGKPLHEHVPTPVLCGIAVNTLAAGIGAPWAVADAAVESLGPGGWLRGLAFVAVAVASPVTASLSLARNGAIPAIARTLGPAAQRPCILVDWLSGLILVATTVLAIATALGLVFDPRYRDFMFAPLTAAVVPFAVASAVGSRGTGRRGTAETIAAATLAGSAVYIVLNEGFANWQALVLAGALLALAVTLARLRDGQST